LTELETEHEGKMRLVDLEINALIEQINSAFMTSHRQIVKMA